MVELTGRLAALQVSSWFPPDVVGFRHVPDSADVVDGGAAGRANLMPIGTYAIFVKLN